MPYSRDADERQHKGKSNNRLEFSSTTRRNLAAAAGHICAIRGCLTPTNCYTNKVDCTGGIANVGRASHIYAAAPNGPRPAPPSMMPKQIRHHSNGIWTCSSCGDIIDRLDCDYSPDQLYEMKKYAKPPRRWRSATRKSGSFHAISPKSNSMRCSGSISRTLRPTRYAMPCWQLLQGRSYAGSRAGAGAGACWPRAICRSSH